MKKPSKAPAQGQDLDGVTVYSFGHQHALTIDLRDAGEYIAFAKSINSSDIVRGEQASLTTLNIVGDYGPAVARVDGQTLSGSASDSTIDSTIKHLIIEIARDESLPSGITVFSNFDRLETVDATKSTYSSYLHFSGDGFNGRSTSAFLESIKLDKGDGDVSVSTVAAAEFESVASLHNKRVHDIDIDTGHADARVTATVQQADVHIKTVAGNLGVDLIFVKGVADHNSSMHGSYGHGVDIELSKSGGSDYMTLLTGNLVNYDATASSHIKSSSIADNLVTVENFNASEDYLNFGASVYKPEAVVAVADSALTGAKDLSSALDVVAQLTVGPVNAAVFNYHGNTYVFDEGHGVSSAGVDSSDSLIELVGSHDLNDVAAHVLAGFRGMGH